MPDEPDLEKEIDQLCSRMQRRLSNYLPPDTIKQLKQGVKERMGKLNQAAQYQNISSALQTKIESLNRLYERSDYYLR